MDTPRDFRPPSFPLVTVDPYFSIWSCADQLAHDRTRHWTLTPHDLVGLARIDGQVLRFMGMTNQGPGWRNHGHTSALRQIRAEVNPTATTYTFDDHGVELVITFTTPLLTDDLEILSRPFSYIDFSVDSTDGRSHEVQIYLEVSASITTGDPDQLVQWSRDKLGSGWTSISAGTLDQNVLGHSGDLTTIDWGYLHLIVPQSAGSRIAPANEARSEFAATGTLVGDDADHGRRGVSSGHAPRLAAAWQLEAGPGASKSTGLAVLGYDDIRSVDYMGRQLKAPCFSGGQSFAQLAGVAATQWPELQARCRTFDHDLLASATGSAGAHYANLVSLAYRQSIAAHKLVVDESGELLFLSKECTSNGSIGTVDVAYPASPLYLLLQPELVAAMLRPVFAFAQSDQWTQPYAPHDVGTYPRATGQTYGLSLGNVDQERQMPVEECGNMLIMSAAYTQRSGSHQLVDGYWKLLAQWADYLVENGLDPESQLCTDDFAGHLAHNVNLSLKAILAIACFGLLCEITGRNESSKHFMNIAAEYAQRWEERAADGDHYRLTFDGPGTWSLKYNLVWDAYFGFGLFDPAVAAAEIHTYLAKADTYGTPLDSRAAFTKTDWLIWASCLASDPKTRAEFSERVWKFVNETPDRTPFCDWYDTHDAREQSFHNRSVIGGIFMPMLMDQFGADARGNASTGRRQ